MSYSSMPVSPSSCPNSQLTSPLFPITIDVHQGPLITSVYLLFGHCWLASASSMVFPVHQQCLFMIQTLGYQQLQNHAWATMVCKHQKDWIPGMWPPNQSDQCWQHPLWCQSMGCTAWIKECLFYHRHNKVKFHTLSSGMNMLYEVA